MRAAAPLIAVLGLGDAGVVHARALLAAGARVGVASKRGAALPFADAVYEGYDAALADPSVSAVVIATPYDTHPELICAAADAGKHVLCEKPLGGNVDTILTARASSQRIRFMTAFQRRWDPAYRAARDRLNSGEIGVPILIKATSGDMTYPEKYLRDGGGAPGAMFLDLAVHDIDLVRWFHRDEVKSVYACADALVHPHIKELDDVDTAVAVLHMRKGGQAVVTLSRALGYGHKVCTELIGSKGSIEIGGVQKTDLKKMVKGTTNTDVFEDYTQRFERAFQRQMKGFVDLVRADEEGAMRLIKENCSYASFDDGARATAVAEALCESAETGLPVNVPNLDSHLEAHDAVNVTVEGK